MTEPDVLSIEMDDEATQLLDQLRRQYARDLLSRALNASEGGSGKLSASDIANAAAEQAAPYYSPVKEAPASWPKTDTGGTATRQNGFARLLLILGSSLLIGSGAAIAALLIPSVVHDDVSLILIAIATLGTAVILISLLGRTASRFTTRESNVREGMPRATSRSPATWPEAELSGVLASSMSWTAGPSQERVAAAVGTANTLQGMSAAWPAGQMPTELSAAPLTAVQLALYAGWTIALLYGVTQDRPEEASPGLPTVRELPAPDRTAVELGRLHRILERLDELPGFTRITANVSATAAGEPDFDTHLQVLHLSILRKFAGTGLELEMAYELGRSLRDTVNPPAGPRPEESAASVLARQLARARVATLQEWLATLSDGFPPQAAAIVGISLGRWSEFAGLTVGTAPAKRGADTDGGELAGQLRQCLLRQGDVWLMLLAGARSTAGLLTPDGYVAAGEAALRRSARIIRGVMAHYWGALLLLAAALCGVLYMAAVNLGGAAKVWTAIAVIGSAMGVSAQSVRSVIDRLSKEAERPVLAATEEDAKAWAITALPHARLTTRAVRHLRRSGIAKSANLGRF